MELFAQRAAAAVPGFALTDANRDEVVGLCRRLDGIPLAVELAAIQLRTTSLRALSGRLEHRFLLLTGGRRVALPHQQTLRTATQWSYDLCSPAERLLWARLSVFAGSFSIPAAQGVGAGGSLDREEILAALIGLVDKGRHWMDKILALFPGPSAERATLLLTRGVLAIFQGELREATADLEASTELSREGGDARACALGCTYLCLAFVFSGCHAEVAAAGATAEERLRAIGHVSGLVSLDIHLGYLHLLTGQPDRAIERCAQGLRRLDGGERWARSYLQVITALGLFLRRRLVISSRTVDAHIASIYSKLGISSRVQLVTWLGAQSDGPPGESG